jgi:hypothetical protein
MQSGATRFLEFYSLGLAVASGVSFAVGVELGPVIKGQIGKLEDSKKIGKVDSAEKLVAVAEDIVGESRQSFPAAACMLTTVAGNQPKARMVNPMSVRLGKNPEVIFNTNRNSRKFKQLKENPNATITYLDPAGTNLSFILCVHSYNPWCSPKYDRPLRRPNARRDGLRQHYRPGGGAAPCGGARALGPHDEYVLSRGKREGRGPLLCVPAEAAAAGAGQ